MNEIDILASLVFDSGAAPIPELRASERQDRHLIFEGGGVLLDLLIKEQEDGKCVHVSGQVLPEDDGLSTVSSIKVLMQQGSRGHACTYTNALGEFTFHAAPGDEFNLTITLKDRRFMIRGLSHADPRMWRVVPAVVAGGARR